MTAVLLIFVAEVNAVQAIFKDTVVFELVVGILVPDRDAVVIIGIDCVVPENAVLHPPAEEDAVTFVMVADTIFNDGMV